MRITKKKVLVTLAIFVGLVLLAAGVFFLLNREDILTSLANQELPGTFDPVPEKASVTPPPLTTGPADWICWRGPAGDGRSLVRDIRTDWTGGLMKLWEVSYLCQGRKSGTWSAPVVRGNRLVVCGRDETRDLVFCLNAADGSLIWRSSYEAEAENAYGTGARATPFIDDDRVYTFGRSGDLVCWSLLDGRLIWRRNVSEEGGEESTWGHSSSPLVAGSLVIVAGGGTARTIAYDKTTGEVRWKTGKGPSGYSAPVRITLGDRPVVLHFHGAGLAAVDLETGEELWDSTWETRYDVNATTPVVDGDHVFITSGYGSGCRLLRIGPDAAEEVWTGDVIASHHSDPVLIDGRLYGYSGQSTQNRGAFKCVELSSGEEKWSTKEMGWGTCVQVGDHLLCMDIKGNLFLMRPDPERFVKVTGMPAVFGEVKGAVWTVPVLANGRLYLRFGQRLLCFRISS